MIDLPLVMFKKDQVLAEEYLKLLNISDYPQITEQADRERIFENFQEPLLRGEQNEEDAFDANAFAALRRRLTGR